MTIKPFPKCPNCHLPMTKVGTKNRGELKPKRVFACMSLDCLNNKRYFRDGQEAR